MNVGMEYLRLEGNCWGRKRIIRAASDRQPEDTALVRGVDGSLDQRGPVEERRRRSRAQIDVGIASVAVPGRFFERLQLLP